MEVGLPSIDIRVRLALLEHYKKLESLQRANLASFVIGNQWTKPRLPRLQKYPQTSLEEFNSWNKERAGFLKGLPINILLQYSHLIFHPGIIITKNFKRLLHPSADHAFGISCREIL